VALQEAILSGYWCSAKLYSANIEPASKASVPER